MITFHAEGSFKNTQEFLQTIRGRYRKKLLHRYAAIGTEALRLATPVDTGLAAESWEHAVYDNKKGTYKIEWSNTNVESGVPVVILIQYGHGTKSGGYIEGRDFINPAIQPIFDELRDRIWKEIENA